MNTNVRVVAGLAAIFVMSSLTGCGAPPWETSATSVPVSSATPTVSATAIPTPIPNDLSSGSTQRALTSGSISATVDYWSTLNLGQWTPDAVKPMSISLVTTTQPDDGHKVYLQRASMTAVPYDDSGALPALELQSDTASVAPGYLVLSPYSYSQSFNVGAVPEDATYVSLDFTFDFLVQTTPTSTEYAKQTVSDRVTVALPQN